MSKTYSKRAIWAWAMFDFANSPFTTLVVTFIFAAYFTGVIAPSENEGTTLWSIFGVTVTALVVALSSPFLGALADRGGFRKVFLLLATAGCVVGTLALSTAQSGEVVKALFWFVIANVSFEIGMVFYNAFLPDVAPADKIGRVSGYGWGLGYFGGLAALVLALVGLVQPEVPWFGISTENQANVRATSVLAALWLVVFSLPFFLFVKEDRSTRSTGAGLFAASARQLAHTFKEIRRYRQILRFLIARMIFNDGLVTIFAIGGIYATTTFGFSFEETIQYGIAINVAAGTGALVMGLLDDKLGGKLTLLVSLVGLIAGSLLAVVAQSKALFWVAGVLVGIFAGPNQSASRSLMGRFVPDDKEAEFFGFFAFSGKATAFIGPFLLGVLTAIFDSQRAGVAVVVVLFVIGGVLLMRVDEAEGARAARRPE